PTKDAGAAINTALGGGAVNASLDTSLFNTVVNIHSGTTNAVAPFSSRGIGMTGDVKPDVAAPGQTVFSVGVGSGSDGVSESGTSMATPHVTGVAALVKAAHRTWSPTQIKAAIMN